jgi:hypothetical protein
LGIEAAEEIESATEVATGLGDWVDVETIDQ